MGIKITSLALGSGVGLSPGISTLTNGSVLFAKNGGISEDNTNLFWEEVNHQLMLGNGAASGPALAGRNFTTTGIFWSAGPLLGFAINGVAALTLSGTNPNLLFDATNSPFFGINTGPAYTGAFRIQGGGGSAGFGGGYICFGHSHATNPGWTMATISSGSGGFFAVNNSGLGGGANVFTVSSAGAVVAAVSYAIGASVGISGTFAPPASITVTGGIITAAA